MNTLTSYIVSSHIIPKLYYFLLFSNYSCIYPFITLIFSSKSILLYQIGFMISIIPIIRLLFNPLWCYISDIYKIHYILCTILYILSSLSLLILLYSNNIIYIIISLVLFSIFNSGIGPLCDARIMMILGDRNLYGKQRLYGALSWGIVSYIVGILEDKYNDITVYFICYYLHVIPVLIIIYCVFSIDTNNNASFQTLKNEDTIDKNDVLELTPHFTIDDEDDELNLEEEIDLNMEKQEEVKYEKSLDGVNLRLVKIETDNDLLDDVEIKDISESNDNNSQIIDITKLSFFQSIALIITSNPYSIVILLVSFFIGLGMSIVTHFLFLYLKNDLGASQSLMGLSLTMTVLFEFPFFFFSDYLNEKLGIRGMFILSHLAYILRVVVYTLITNPWNVLLVEPMHGVTFACAWCSIVHYANLVAPKGLEATSQGLFSGVFNGLGTASGALIGGLLYEYLGAHMMFRIASFILLFSLILFIVLTPERLKQFMFCQTQTVQTEFNK